MEINTIAELQKAIESGLFKSEEHIIILCTNEKENQRFRVLECVFFKKDYRLVSQAFKAIRKTIAKMEADFVSSL